MTTAVGAATGRPYISLLSAIMNIAINQALRLSSGDRISIAAFPCGENLSFLLFQSTLNYCYC